MTAGGVVLYLAGLCAAYFGGLTWGLTVKFIAQLGQQS